MNRFLRFTFALLPVLALTGCAGGWRDGAPPGAATETAAATPATAAKAPAGGADGVTFTYNGPGSTVHLAGEFNAWSTSADPMTKQADGSWTLVKKLEPGRYPYKFVIDGGTWKEDAAAAEFVDDGFGGKNSVVVVGGTTAQAAPAGTAAPAAPAASGPTGTARPPASTAEGVTFTFAGVANTVHLAGDFNAWSTTADPMTKRADGSWTLLKKLEPGTYGYKFVVNGTTWKQDEANPEFKDDGFGGKNSVVVVK